MTWISAIIAVFKGLPIIRDMFKMFGEWGTKFSAWNKKRKFKKRRRNLDEAYTKAKKTKNTEDLQDELEKLL